MGHWHLKRQDLIRAQMKTYQCAAESKPVLAEECSGRHGFWQSLSSRTDSGAQSQGPHRPRAHWAALWAEFSLKVSIRQNTLKSLFLRIKMHIYTQKTKRLWKGHWIGLTPSWSVLQLTEVENVQRATKNKLNFHFQETRGSQALNRKFFHVAVP